MCSGQCPDLEKEQVPNLGEWEKREEGWEETSPLVVQVSGGDGQRNQQALC